MFEGARRRLTIQAVLLFGAVLLTFSIVFYAVLTSALAPSFDLAPELPNDEAARRAYAQTVQLIGVALILANVVALSVATLAGYLLAGRTLRPIRATVERQRRFVADASHEMRSPLTVIRSTIDVALMDPQQSRVAAPTLTAVADATDRLARLTADLLLLARTEDGMMPASTDPVDLSVAVAEATMVARTTLGATVELSLAPDLSVTAEAEALQRVVLNLIDNAWRYSGGEPVVVRTHASERSAVLEVIDHGPGIAAADLERIFEPFHRVRAGRDTPPGSGLGLAIVQSLTRSWGGRISLESRLGSGSTFRLELPRRR